MALTKSIARAFGKDNIKAFSIAPGFVRTTMAEEFIKENGEDLVLGEIALPQLTMPEDISPTAVFLASGMIVSSRVTPSIVQRTASGTSGRG